MAALSSSEMMRLKQSLLLGLIHDPAAQANGLAGLSLIAAHSRFARQRPPPRETALPRDESATDGKRLLPDAARTLLTKLFSGKDGKTSDAIAHAVMQAIKRARLRLHPFDYARLEDFILQFGEELGPEERSWLKAVRPDRKQAHASYDDEPVSEDTLPQAGKAQKLAFLKALRHSDPDKARALIAQLLPAETASLRAELIGLISIGLGAADKAFLESLAADRAQSVREAAALLLARLPGTSAYQKKLEQLKDRIEIKKAGLLRRRSAFSLRSAPKPNAAFDPLHGLNENKELFEGARLEDIASVLQVSLADLIAGSLESPDLGHLLLRCALLEGRWADANTFSPLFAGDVSHQTVFLLSDLLPRLDESGRAALLNLAFVPGRWNSLPSFHVFMGLNGALDGPLSHEKASGLLQSAAWREAMRQASDEVRVHTLEAVAPLIPRTLSESFIADSEAHSRRATFYHRFLLSLPEPADVRT